jgi:hypothetical protein
VDRGFVVELLLSAHTLPPYHNPVAIDTTY